MTNAGGSAWENIHETFPLFTYISLQVLCAVIAIDWLNYLCFGAEQSSQLENRQKIPSICEYARLIITASIWGYSETAMNEKLWHDNTAIKLVTIISICYLCYSARLTSFLYFIYQMISYSTQIRLVSCEELWSWEIMYILLFCELMLISILNVKEIKADENFCLWIYWHHKHFCFVWPFFCFVSDFMT